MKEKTTKPLISVSIPVLNEASNLHVLYKRLCNIANVLKNKYEFEFVFSDNHSDDDTWQILNEIASTDNRVKAIRFSKNFGFQRSILANYLHTKGVGIMQIDADLQDPPELIMKFIDYWCEGYDVVYGVRKKRSEGILINNIRKVGYWLIDKISDHPIPRDAGDFRFMDRKVVNALLNIKAPKPYLRGIIADLGFKQIGVPYSRQAREKGESKFNLGRLFGLGLTAVFNHSAVPLRLASLLGLIILVFSVVGALYYFVFRLINPDLPQGLASIHILVLFGIGLIAFLLGIIGEYIYRIYLTLRCEPIAIIEQSVNFDTSELKL